MRRCRFTNRTDRPVRGQPSPEECGRFGHLKEDHHLGRNYLKGRDGDRSDAVLASAGYKLSLHLPGSGAYCAPYC
jgi:hypothetical protein